MAILPQIHSGHLILRSLPKNSSSSASLRHGSLNCGRETQTLKKAEKYKRWSRGHLYITYSFQPIPGIGDAVFTNCPICKWDKSNELTQNLYGHGGILNGETPMHSGYPNGGTVPPGMVLESPHLVQVVCVHNSIP